MRLRVPAPAQLAAFAAGALVLGFIVLPLVGLVAYQTPAELINNANAGVVGDAVGVSLKCNLIAVALTLLLGTPVAYALARSRFPGRSIVVTLVELPVVLPPAVAGIALLVTWGRLGLFGHELTVLGINLAFSQAAVVIAVMFVAGPYYVRGAIGAFESVEETLLDVAATLGAGPLRCMLRVALPLARGGLAAAAALSFARGLGEFGATILFAGSFQGTTETLPLAVYSLFEVNLAQAIAVGVVLLVLSAVILLFAKLFVSWARSVSISR